MVKYSLLDQAKKAMNGTKIKGRKIRIKFSRTEKSPRKPFSPQKSLTQRGRPPPGRERAPSLSGRRCPDKELEEVSDEEEGSRASDKELEEVSDEEEEELEEGEISDEEEEELEEGEISVEDEGELEEGEISDEEKGIFRSRSISYSPRRYN